MYTFRKSAKLSLTNHVRQLFACLVKGGGDKNANEEKSRKETKAGSEESRPEAEARQEGSEESRPEA